MRKILFFFALCVFSFSALQAQMAGGPNAVKNVILMIGDGMGPTQLYSGMTVNKGTLNIEKAQAGGLVKTYSANDYTTDSAAGGTALATGTKTNNGMIGVDPSGNKVLSLAVLAKQKGLASGIVATCGVTHATPASFYAHAASRNSEEEIAKDFLSSQMDVLIGGGRDMFEKRKDGVNLSESLRSSGYQVVYTMQDLKALRSGKVVALLAEGHLPSKLNGRGEELTESVVAAMNVLKANSPKGFFLMVEGSQIDWEAHNGKTEGVAAEVIDFDKAIGAAFDFADKNPGTLVVITADHETGGMHLVTGDTKAGTVEARYLTTGYNGHTGTFVPVLAYGSNARDFGGIMENTQIFTKLKALLKL